MTKIFKALVSSMSIAIIVSVTIAQIIPLGNVGAPVISYCSSVGYPTSPVASGLQMWFSGDCITFVSSVCGTPANGTVITTWADRTGNGHTATSAGGTTTFQTNVLNGLPGVTLASNPGWNTAGSITSNDLHTAFAEVLSTQSTSNSATIFGGGTGAFQWYTRTAQGMNSAGLSLIGTGTIVIGTGWNSLMSQETGSSSGPGTSLIFHVNRVNDALTAGPNGANVGPPSTLFYRPTTEQYQGSAVELFYYNTQLNSTDIIKNECYLYGRYKI